MTLRCYWFVLMMTMASLYGLPAAAQAPKAPMP